MTTHPIANKPPVAAKAMLILYTFQVILAFTFFFIFKAKNLEVGGLTATHVLYTAGAYTILYLGALFSYFKKNIWVLRICFILHFLISLPTRAYIGMLIAVILIFLSFRKAVQTYFKS